MDYQIKLDVFEGPLDLLLFFIKRDEINIHNIPIAYITEEFLDYIHMARKMDIQLAGEFLEMAVMLIRIKTKMLLPDQDQDEEEDIEDPRNELVDMLMEYKKYKKVSELLEDLEEKSGQHFTVQLDDHTEQDYDPDLFLSDVNLMELGTVFKELLQNMSEPSIYEVEKIELTTDDQQLHIIEKMGERSRISFTEITEELDNKIEVVVTFLALLELVKMDDYVVKQNELFEEIHLEKRKQGEEIGAKA